MPAIPSLLAIVPLSEQAAVKTATGIHTGDPGDPKVYPAADAPPRSEWGGRANLNIKNWTQAQRDAATQADIDNPGSTFLYYNAPNSTAVSDEMAADRTGIGQHPPLTTDPN